MFSIKGICHYIRGQRQELRRKSHRPEPAITYPYPFALYGVKHENGVWCVTASDGRTLYTRATRSDALHLAEVLSHKAERVYAAQQEDAANREAIAAFVARDTRMREVAK